MNDTISRQQTITALRALSDEDGYINAPHEVVTDVVRGLPPVRAKQGQTTRSEQPKKDKFGVKTGETCEDCISRQAAIDAIFGRSHEIIKMRIGNLPSAQPEMIREIRKWINSSNRGNADYFIVDKIEEIINKYE